MQRKLLTDLLVAALLLVIAASRISRYRNGFYV
jgi:hypothetical protein